MTDQAIMYSGDSAYRYIDPLIKEKDRELMIISPYISNFYTKKLIKASQSKKIRVITSPSSTSYKDAMINNFVSHGMKGYYKTLLTLVFVDLILIYFGVIYGIIAITSIIALIAAIAYRRYDKIDTNMQVKVIKDKFVHEKLYIGGETAISGSANLTFNGMHKNIEHVEVTKDAYKIDQMRSHFEVMWDNN